MFEGVRGYGYLGDIAIDDIGMTPGSCAGVATCDFESGVCGWMQLTSDDFDWTRKRGSTPSSNTGPTVDHTLKTTTGTYKHIPLFKTRFIKETLMAGDIACNILNDFH